MPDTRYSVQASASDLLTIGLNLMVTSVIGHAMKELADGLVAQVEFEHGIEVIVPANEAQVLRLVNGGGTPTRARTPAAAPASDSAPAAPSIVNTGADSAWLTRREATELGMTYSALSRGEKSGAIKTKRDGRNVFLRRADVEKFAKTEAEAKAA